MPNEHAFNRCSLKLLKMKMCCWSVLKTIAFQVVEVKEEVWSPYRTPAAWLSGKGQCFLCAGWHWSFEWNSTDCLFTATVHYLIGRLNELDQRLSSLFRWPILKKWPTGETFYLKPIFCEGLFGRTVTSPELKSLQLWGCLVHVWCSYGIRWLLLILREDVHLPVIRTVCSL